MNKKFINGLLLATLLAGTAGSFTSCKDYDDDIDNLQNQKKVPTAGKEIDSFEGCVTVDKMTDVQKAPEHDAV